MDDQESCGMTNSPKANSDWLYRWVVLVLLILLLVIQFSSMAMAWWKVSRLTYVEAVYIVPHNTRPVLGDPPTLKRICGDWLKKSALYVDKTKPSIALVDGKLHVEFAASATPATVLLDDLGAFFSEDAKQRSEKIQQRQQEKNNCTIVPAEDLKLDHWGQRRELGIKLLDVLTGLFLVLVIVAWVKDRWVR